MTDDEICNIKGQYKVVYTSTYSKLSKKGREEIKKEEITIDYTGGNSEFSIHSEKGPTKEWDGSFTVREDCPHFAFGTYKYKGSGAQGKHEYLIDTQSLRILVNGKNKSKHFSLVLERK